MPKKQKKKPGFDKKLFFNSLGRHLKKEEKQALVKNYILSKFSDIKSL